MLAANNAIAQPSMSCQIEFHLIQIIEVVALHRKENITRPGRASQQYGPHVIGACPRDVRFTPEGRHYGARLECPLCAKSGHWKRSGEVSKAYSVARTRRAAPPVRRSQCVARSSCGAAA